MITATAQSKGNFCKRNCKLYVLTDKSGHMRSGYCLLGKEPVDAGPRHPRKGGAYFVRKMECEAGEPLEERRW